MDKPEDYFTDDEEATPEDLLSVGCTAIMLILIFLAILFLIAFLIM